MSQLADKSIGYSFTGGTQTDVQITGFFFNILKQNFSVNFPCSCLSQNLYAQHIYHQAYICIWLRLASIKTPLVSKLINTPHGDLSRNN